MVYSKPECQSVIGNLELKRGSIIQQGEDALIVKSINPIRSRTVLGGYEIGLFCIDMKTDKIATLIYSEELMLSTV